MAMIYLDHAATTPVLPEVMEAMLPYYKEKYGNPSSAYEIGADRKQEIEKVRAFIAKSLNASSQEIYFTSGGTESDNWVLKGFRNQYINKSIHFITSEIEHHAVLHSCKSLVSKDVSISYIGVDEEGVIRIDELDRAFNSNTVLVSVMYANNEVGSIQPVKNISYLCKEHGVLFHTDAVQAYGHIPINVNDEGIDFLSASAHKFGGPKGVGFLYIRDGLELPSMIHGGAQESGKRAGTENVAGIIGMGKAAKLAMSRMAEEEKKIRRMRDYLEDRFLREIPYSRINGPADKRKKLPGHLNISFQFIKGPELVALLDGKGICVSAGSACNSGSREISHVLSAMYVPEEMAGGTIRITIGRENTMEEMSQVIVSVKKCVEHLRKKSSSYEDFCLANNAIL